MIFNFLLGLSLALVSLVIIAFVVFGVSQFINYIKEKRDTKKKHKVAFADTRMIADDYLKNKANDSKEISMEDLERICNEASYVSAIVDEEGNIDEFEGIKVKETDSQVKKLIKEKEGMIIFEEND